MSGICGIVRFDNDPRGLSDVTRMTHAMSYRGPDGIAHWYDDKVALGHCLLRTTEEAAEEVQPLRNEQGSIVLVMDGTLWNASELRRQLTSAGAVLRNRSDSELVLRSYEIWGRDCLSQIDGDFALAIYNLWKREVFCARDRVGMRPLYWHQSSQNGFCFASDPEALLAIPGMPRRLNETRIADTFFEDLEGYDLESTLYLDLARLPPAHQLVAMPGGVKRERYWTMALPPTLKLRSEKDYEAAFRSVMTEAVHRRLRGGPRTGTMLSGGVDSGAVSALAAEVRSKTGGGPLTTFSAVGGAADGCQETKAIRTSVEMMGIQPHFVDYTRLGDLTEELVEHMFRPSSPFDAHMSMIRSIYLSARRAGLRAVLDGVGGDSVLNDGQLLAYLLRRGRFVRALREARGPPGVVGLDPASVRLLGAAKAAFVPSWLRAEILRTRATSQFPRYPDRLIRGDFARRTAVLERRAVRNIAAAALSGQGSPACRALLALGPDITVARERYERVASRMGIEARDPFLDLQLMSLCFSLPVGQLTSQGWPKSILRRSMQALLPGTVVWRPERTHLGWKFTSAVLIAAHKLARLVKSSECEDYVELANLERNVAEFIRWPGDDNVRLRRTLPSLSLGHWLSLQKSPSCEDAPLCVPYGQHQCELQHWRFSQTFG
jgi:asparagine synthase (glutamine-hydrolysing)